MHICIFIYAFICNIPLTVELFVIVLAQIIIKRTVIEHTTVLLLWTNSKQTRQSH